MDLIFIAEALKGYLPLMALLSAPLGGGVFVIFLSSLFFENISSLILIFLLSFIGFLFFDSLLFFIGRGTKLFNFLRSRYISTVRSKGNKFYKDSIRKNYLTTIFFSKIVYGFAVPTMLLLGRKEKNYGFFLILDSVVNFILISLFVLFGFFIGNGLNFLGYSFENKTLITFFLFFILFLIYLSERLFRKYILKKF